MCKIFIITWQFFHGLGNGILYVLCLCWECNFLLLMEFKLLAITVIYCTSLQRKHNRWMNGFFSLNTISRWMHVLCGSKKIVTKSQCNGIHIIYWLFSTRHTISINFTKLPNFTMLIGLILAYCKTIRICCH